MQYISRVDRALPSVQAVGVIRRASVVGEVAPGTPVKDVELAGPRGTPLLHPAIHLCLRSPLGRAQAPTHERIVAACEAGDATLAAEPAEWNRANPAVLLEEKKP